MMCVASGQRMGRHQPQPAVPAPSGHVSPSVSKSFSYLKIQTKSPGVHGGSGFFGSGLAPHLHSMCSPEPLLGDSRPGRTAWWLRGFGEAARHPERPVRS